MNSSTLKERPSKARVTRKAAASRCHEEATVESFRKDARFAAAYLNAGLADSDQEELMVALRCMARAFGGVQQLAQSAELHAPRFIARGHRRAIPGCAA